MHEIFYGKGILRHFYGIAVVNGRVGFVQSALRGSDGIAVERERANFDPVVENKRFGCGKSRGRYVDGKRIIAYLVQHGIGVYFSVESQRRNYALVTERVGTRRGAGKA